MTKESREVIIDILSRQDLDLMDDESIFFILKDGCRGYSNFSDDELLEEYNK